MRIFIIGVILVFCCLIIGCGYHTYTIPTAVMEPTIKINSRVLMDETAYLSNKPINRFDIIIHKVFINEEMRHLGISENTKFIHRVIAFGGEKVEMKKGQVFVDEKLLEEPFKKNASKDDFGPIVIPENEFFLLGDNRPESDDSRYWKPATIKRESILGKLVIVYW